ncbi:MAG: sugar kinase [Bacteroidetes bacterium]|nr:sugar kinase [Bacteroidota bacterium]
MKKKVVTFGELMMRLSGIGHARLVQAASLDVVYAGAEANVAVALSNMGIDSAHVTRFPDSDLGRAAVNSLRMQGVDTGHILFGKERMGIYFVENGAMQRPSRIIYDRYDSAFAHIKPGMVDWKHVLKDASWLHWTGITPAVSQGAADTCMEAVTQAFQSGVKISGDINYRRVLWKYGKNAIDVMPSLIAKSHYIVGGVSDIENCTGLKAGSFEEAAILLKKNFSSVVAIANVDREIVNASHNRIAGALWIESGISRSKTYDLTHIVDRIGAGDAFMAGWIYSILNNRTSQEQVDFATAACALKHSVEGDANLVSAMEIQDLVSEVNVGKLLR